MRKNILSQAVEVVFKETNAAFPQTLHQQGGTAAMLTLSGTPGRQVAQLYLEHAGKTSRRITFAAQRGERMWMLPRADKGYEKWVQDTAIPFRAQALGLPRSHSDWAIERHNADIADAPYEDGQRVIPEAPGPEPSVEDLTAMHGGGEEQFLALEARDEEARNANRCTALTRKGQPCRNQAVAGGKCHVHAAMVG